MDVILKGTHGTTLYHKNNILAHGFKVPDKGEGKAGRGIYFWYYINDNSHAFKLSQYWWEYAFKKEIYDISQDCSFRVLDVEIKIEEENILDFAENFEIYEKFLNTYPDGEPEKEYGAKLDLFIKVFEKNLGKIFELVKVNLSVPNLRNIAFANSYPALILKVQKDITIKQIIE